MANLNEKLEQLEKIMKSWKESLNMTLSEITRDSSILQFELAFELFWKVVKIYMEEIEEIKCYSPKSCFRKLRNTLDLSEEDIEFCFKMLKDRNFATHAYSEENANALYEKLGNYWKITEKIYNRIKRKSA